MRTACIKSLCALFWSPRKQFSGKFSKSGSSSILSKYLCIMGLQSFNKSSVIPTGKDLTSTRSYPRWARIYWSWNWRRVPFGMNSLTVTWIGGPCAHLTWISMLLGDHSWIWAWKIFLSSSGRCWSKRLAVQNVSTCEEVAPFLVILTSQQAVGVT